MRKLVDWGITSHQQIRSYGDGTSVYSPIRRAGEARDRTCDPLVYKASDIYNYCTIPWHVFGYLSVVSDRAPPGLSFTRFNLAVKSMKILTKLYFIKMVFFLLIEVIRQVYSNFLVISDVSIQLTSSKFIWFTSENRGPRWRSARASDS